MSTPPGVDDVIREFLVESYENLDRLDGELLALESGESTRETLATIFRIVHTIKGTCGFLGLPKLETLAHRAENVLSLLRDDKLAIDAAITDVLLKSVDAIREILAHLETKGSEGDLDTASLLEALERIANGETPAPSPAATPPAVAAATTPEEDADEPVDDTTPPETVQAEAAAPSSESAPARSTVTESAIRVDVELLDHVMNLVGELVLARNQILQFAPSIKDAGFANASARLNLLTTELQEGVMKTRMQPIGNAWNKLPRLVRDLSQGCGKQVALDLDGAETELDRTIIEAIRDPLTHAVRNSIDHGVEPPEVRTANGKPAQGRVRLRAYHEGGQVNIEISDDGAGLNIERIRDRGVERGLVSRERAAQLSEREVAHLVFHPGFSTAAKITNVSGRGVGMDVVKTNIERIGGSVDISSNPGHGTTLRIKIPLTLAIIPALIVVSRGERFAIPQVNLLELVRLEGERARSEIERLYGTPFYRLRGDLLPLVFLDECLELADADERTTDEFSIVVLQAGDRQFGLVVDAISDTEEIVVKPLGKELKRISVFAGATIMGDGQVALIPDVLGIAQRAHLLANGRGQAALDTAVANESERESTEALLLFTTGQARMAIPLSIVARLEEISPARVESTGSGPVVQYRGRILPVVDLTGTLDERMGDAEAEPVNMIVYEDGDRSVGIVVERILDAVDETLNVRHNARGAGTRGSAVIQGSVTDLLDVQALVDSVAPPTYLEEAA